MSLIVFFWFNLNSRIYKHLGCQHGCSDGQRGPAAEFLRTQCQNILTKLNRASGKEFKCFLKDFIKNHTLPDILEFFHAYVGFCIDPSSLLSPLSKSSYVIWIWFRMLNLFRRCWWFWYKRRRRKSYVSYIQTFSDEVHWNIQRNEDAWKLGLLFSYLRWAIMELNIQFSEPSLWSKTTDDLR